MGFELISQGINTLLNSRKTFAEAKKKAQLKNAIINIAIISGLVIFPIIFLITILTGFNGLESSILTLSFIKNPYIELAIIFMATAIATITLVALQSILTKSITTILGGTATFIEIFYSQSLVLVAATWLVLFNGFILILTSTMNVPLVGLLVALGSLIYIIHLNVVLVSELTKISLLKATVIGVINSLIPLLIISMIINSVIMPPATFPLNAKEVIPESLKKVAQRGSEFELKERVIFTPGIITAREVIGQSSILPESIKFSCDKNAVSCGKDLPIEASDDKIVVDKKIAGAVAICTDGTYYYIVIGHKPLSTKNDALEKCGLE